MRLEVSGLASLLVTGLGPVGLAAAMIGRAMGAGPVVGTDVSPERMQLALDLGLVDHAVPADQHAATLLSEFANGCSATVDCSGNATARHLALSQTATWGRCAFVGEGGSVGFDVSPLLIHKQVTLHGWRLQPSAIVTDTFSLDDVGAAYELADRGTSGKVVITFP